jgi:hypothetical protein
MNIKKILPVLLLVIMALVALSIKNCRTSDSVNTSSRTTTNETTARTGHSPNVNQTNKPASQNGLDRNPSNLFYTKYAKCRMKCRHITQREVESILVNGNINYNKSELQNERGPKYAVEGNTDDGQHIRIIFAPNRKHISVVTVIDLEEDYACSCS